MDDNRVGLGQALNPEDQINKTKNLRKEIDALITAVKSDMAGNREVSLVITKLQEARMWAGQNLANYSDEFSKSQFADKADEPESL